MTLYGVRHLTPAQLALGRRACDRARTLNDRLRELRHVAHATAANPTDVEAVRGWLFDLHRDDGQGRVARRPLWAGLVDLDG